MILHDDASSGRCLTTGRTRRVALLLCVHPFPRAEGTAVPPPCHRRFVLLCVHQFRVLMWRHRGRFARHEPRLLEEDLAEVKSECGNRHGTAMEPPSTSRGCSRRTSPR